MNPIQGQMKDGFLHAALSGRIDTESAPECERQLQALCAQYAGAPLELDAAQLSYISSAGLRVLLRIRKSKPEMRIVNVAPEVYEIFEMTGFTEMMEIRKAFRSMSVEGCEILGEGSNGVVYRYNPELVVKVYRNPNALDDIRKERDLARKALVLGIPTAISFDVVKVGDRYASVFELLNAKSFTKLIKAEPEKLDTYVKLYVDLLRQIHATEVSPDDMPDMKATALRWTEFLKGHLDDAIQEKLCALIRAVPDRHTMIHGDFHTSNVEMQNGEVLLIDMDTLSYGHPIFDLASMYLAYRAFGELDHSITGRFLKLPYELAGQIFDRSLQMYLNTDDTQRLRAVMQKAEIIAHTRLLRRTIRRDAETEFGKRQIAWCRQKLAELVPACDSLAFEI